MAQYRTYILSTYIRPSTWLYPSYNPCQRLLLVDLHANRPSHISVFSFLFQRGLQYITPNLAPPHPSTPHSPRARNMPFRVTAATDATLDCLCAYRFGINERAKNHGVECNSPPCLHASNVVPPTTAKRQHRIPPPKTALLLFHGWMTHMRPKN